jgi:hypothetical protein
VACHQVKKNPFWWKKSVFLFCENMEITPKTMLRKRGKMEKKNLVFVSNLWPPFYSSLLLPPRSPPPRLNPSRLRRALILHSPIGSRRPSRGGAGRDAELYRDLPGEPLSARRRGRRRHGRRSPRAGAISWRGARPYAAVLWSAETVLPPRLCRARRGNGPLLCPPTFRLISKWYV